MFGSEAVTGRTILVVLEPGDGVLEALVQACLRFGVTDGYVPVFLGAFRVLTLIGAGEPPADEDEPMPESITVRNCEGHGTATVARGSEGPLVHLHASVGAKGDSARAHSGHVLSGVVQYPTEVVLVELLSPALERRPNASARGLATLTFPIE